MELNNKVVLISGGSKGLGKSLVKLLLEKGCKVAFCARNIEALVQELNNDHTENQDFYAQNLDVKDTVAIEEFVQRSENTLGPIDVLINNVGANTAKASLIDIDLEDWEHMYSVNMRAPMLFSRAVAQSMVKRKSAGVIVNIQSSVCLFSNPGVATYTATKSGFDALSKVFRKELRDHHIKVFNVYPGGIDTEFRTLDRPDYLSPDDVALTVVNNLELPDALYIDDIVLRPFVERNF